MFIFFSFVFHLTAIKADSMSNAFKIYKNTALKLDIGIDKLALTKSQAELFCISLCNSNPDCLTVVFENMQPTEKKCFLFNRIFDSTEHTSNINSNLYEKKSKRDWNHS